MRKVKRLGSACSVGRWSFEEGEEQEVPDLVAAGLVDDPLWEVERNAPPIAVPTPTRAPEPPKDKEVDDDG